MSFQYLKLRTTSAGDGCIGTNDNDIFPFLQSDFCSGWTKSSSKFFAANYLSLRLTADEGRIVKYRLDS